MDKRQPIKRAPKVLSAVIASSVWMDGSEARFGEARGKIMGMGMGNSVVNLSPL